MLPKTDRPGGVMISRKFGRTAALFTVAALALAACGGLPDSHFGSGGITVAPIMGEWQAAVPLADGKYLAAASDNFGAGKVFRFNGDGTIDTTYADRGAFSVNCGGFTVAPDGRFFCFNDNADDVVTAYTANATPDTGFAGGTIHVPFETGSFGSGVSPAGDLYLLFQDNITSSTPNLSIRRYNEAGLQDPHYVAAMGPDQTASVVGFGPGGSMFAYHGLIFSNYALTKFTSTGSPDPTFANNGSIVLPSQMVIDSVAVDHFGGVAILVHENRLHLILRYLPNGQADQAFGWHGIVAAPPLVNTSGPITIDSQRRVVVTASRGNSPGPVQVLRLLTNGQLDPLFGIGGKTTLTAIHGVSLLTSRVLRVSADGLNRPILWLSGFSGAPAVARLSG
jgi:uncharacterized delta-60 repeat protein